MSGSLDVATCNLIKSVAKHIDIPIAGISTFNLETTGSSQIDDAATLKAKQSVNILFKTKICASTNLGKPCPSGDNCHYAHSEAELRPIPNFTRTTMCKLVVAGETCENENCKFAHSREELRTSELGTVKLRMCNFHAKGRCKDGENCRFAHEITEFAGAPLFKAKRRRRKRKSRKSTTNAIGDDDEDDDEEEEEYYEEGEESDDDFEYKNILASGPSFNAQNMKNDSPSSCYNSLDKQHRAHHIASAATTAPPPHLTSIPSAPFHDEDDEECFETLNNNNNNNNKGYHMGVHDLNSTSRNTIEANADERVSSSSSSASFLQPVSNPSKVMKILSRPLQVSQSPSSQFERLPLPSSSSYHQNPSSNGCLFNPILLTPATKYRGGLHHSSAHNNPMSPLHQHFLSSVNNTPRVLLPSCHTETPSISPIFANRHIPPTPLHFNDNGIMVLQSDFGFFSSAALNPDGQESNNTHQDDHLAIMHHYHHFKNNSLHADTNGDNLNDNKCFGNLVCSNGSGSVSFSPNIHTKNAHHAIIRGGTNCDSDNENYEEDPLAFSTLVSAHSQSFKGSNQNGNSLRHNDHASACNARDGPSLVVSHVVMSVFQSEEGESPLPNLAEDSASSSIFQPLLDDNKQQQHQTLASHRVTRSLNLPLSTINGEVSSCMSSNFNFYDPHSLANHNLISSNNYLPQEAKTTTNLMSTYLPNNQGFAVNSFLSPANNSNLQQQQQQSYNSTSCAAPPPTSYNYGSKSSCLSLAHALPSSWRQSASSSHSNVNHRLMPCSPHSNNQVHASPVGSLCVASPVSPLKSPYHHYNVENPAVATNFPSAHPPPPVSILMSYAVTSPSHAESCAEQLSNKNTHSSSNFQNNTTKHSFYSPSFQNSSTAANCRPEGCLSTFDSFCSSNVMNNKNYNQSVVVMNDDDDKIIPDSSLFTCEEDEKELKNRIDADEETQVYHERSGFGNEFGEEDINKDCNADKLKANKIVYEQHIDICNPTEGYNLNPTNQQEEHHQDTKSDRVQVFVSPALSPSRFTENNCMNKYGGVNNKSNHKNEEVSDRNYSSHQGRIYGKPKGKPHQVSSSSYYNQTQMNNNYHVYLNNNNYHNYSGNNRSYNKNQGHYTYNKFQNTQKEQLENFDHQKEANNRFSVLKSHPNKPLFFNNNSNSYPSSKYNNNNNNNSTSTFSLKPKWTTPNNTSNKNVGYSKNSFQTSHDEKEDMASFSSEWNQSSSNSFSSYQTKGGKYYRESTRK